jgi:cytochrome c553
MAATLAMAAPTGNTLYIPTIDVFGAHLNGGRGCAGCHAPHSGARGNGWVITSPGAGNSGDQALWGTDVSAILADTNIVFDSGDGGVAIPWNTAGTFKSDPLFKDVATCLSCHDGNVSKGAMMSGVSWEQAQGMLDFSGGNPNAPKLYGTAAIPTLLGNDGAGAGDYNNDHPVGPGGSNIAAGDLVTTVNNNLVPNWGITFGQSSRGGLTVTAAAGSPYAAFIGNYGDGAVTSMVFPVGSTNYLDAFVVCTTCHNQHNMVVVSGTYGSVAGGQFQTYFFVRAPYNPGAPYDKTHAPSTMQFCRQCHFPESNEAYGNYNIGTAF